MGRSQLAKYGVGGIFHFISQSNNDESRQRPSLYIIVTFNRKEGSVFLWMYRILSVFGGIAVEFFLPPKQSKNIDPRGEWIREFYWDTTQIPDFGLKKFNKDEVGVMLRDRAFRDIEDKEFYHYCGWGFANPQYRENFGFQLVHEGEKHVVTLDGLFPEGFATKILEQIQAITNYQGKITIQWGNQYAKGLQTNI